MIYAKETVINSDTSTALAVTKRIVLRPTAPTLLKRCETFCFVSKFTRERRLSTLSFPVWGPFAVLY